jgi:uncharacterized membrane protein YfcA
MMNAVAGGGSFLTFPALVFTGVPSIIANASSTLALLPASLVAAWAYRDDFKESTEFPFRPMLAVSLAGGIGGALLLLLTPQKTFDVLLPWLMLAATIMFAAGPSVSPFLQRKFRIGTTALICVQFAVALYGGYFGGAIGILMLAAWSLFGLTSIHVMNANKTLLAAAMNGVAVVLFIIARKIWWPQTLAMLAAGIIGGYLGARGAKRVDGRYVRFAVILISAAITVVFFLRHRA